MQNEFKGDFNFLEGKTIIGLQSNTTKDKHCFMLDIDGISETELMSIRNKLHKMFPSKAILILSTFNGYHIIVFVELTFREYIKNLLILNNHDMVCLNFLIFTVEDGYGCLRLTSKHKEYDLKIYSFSFYETFLEAETHFYIYASIFNFESPDSFGIEKGGYAPSLKVYFIPDSWN